MISRIAKNAYEIRIFRTSEFSFCFADARGRERFKRRLAAAKMIPGKRIYHANFFSQPMSANGTWERQNALTRANRSEVIRLRRPRAALGKRIEAPLA